ncbi:MAG: heavy-metal-associated domain-containing protein [Clostridiales bacterium]|uniref:heavy-metal-associated domain-containing protein n=1 Tax=Clostridium sp. N3C TaxID=1776758 RepID=UPI00092E041F|nr:cation transporter [Clostridium sp. N3C]NLZ48008.1 heavy-metal-associated domain-containing protein [Clostridiales bacterium]SCN24864.1 Copper chaperone CopZ [Clostridium sp. N3C]
MAKKIIIEGMSCGHCVKHVTAALEELGLSKVNVDLDSKIALIEGDASDQAIKAAIEDAGYEVVEIKNV